MVLEAAALSRVNSLSGLSKATLARLGEVTVSRRYDAGAGIVAHQSSDHHFFMILAGTVRVSLVANTGRPLTYQLLPAGEVFGEISAIDSLERTASVSAESECVIGQIEQTDFLQLLRACDDFAFVILQRLARLNRRLIERVYEYHAYDVRGRIYAEILRASADSTTYTITDKDMASRVGTTRENVSRIVRDLHNRKILHRQRHQTEVLDRAALTELLSLSEFG